MADTVNKVLFPAQLGQMFDFPLIADETFESLSDANDYLASPISNPGRIVSINDGTGKYAVYVINNVGGVKSLTSVGGGSGPVIPEELISTDDPNGLGTGTDGKLKVGIVSPQEVQTIWDGLNTP